MFRTYGRRLSWFRETRERAFKLLVIRARGFTFDFISQFPLCERRRISISFVPWLDWIAAGFPRAYVRDCFIYKCISLSDETFNLAGCFLRWQGMRNRGPFHTHTIRLCLEDRSIPFPKTNRNDRMLSAIIRLPYVLRLRIDSFVVRQYSCAWLRANEMLWYRKFYRAASWIFLRNAHDKIKTH